MSFHSFNGMSDWLRAREANNKTTDVLTDGARGEGKSNVTLLEMYILEPRLDFRFNYVYDKADLIRVMPIWEPMNNVRVCFDEAKNLVYKRNALTNVNKSVSILQTQIREKKGTRFWNTPDIEELEGFLTKDQCDICQTVPRRGTLEVWRFWKNYHAPPGKREGRWIKAFNKSNIPNMEDILPHVAQAYRTWKTQGFQRVRVALGEKMEAKPPERREPKKEAVVALIKANPDKSAADIARMIGVTQSYVRTLRQGVTTTSPVVVI
jgi:hypothetical protein